MTEHELEGRTAHECFELARIALDQAEQVLNRSTSTMECAKAQASAAIALGWARLGHSLAHEPIELERQTFWSIPEHVHGGLCLHTWNAEKSACQYCGRRPEIRATGPALTGYCAQKCPEAPVALSPTLEDLDPQVIAGWVRERFASHDNALCPADDPRKCWICSLRAMPEWPDTPVVDKPIRLEQLADVVPPDPVTTARMAKAHRWPSMIFHGRSECLDCGADWYQEPGIECRPTACEVEETAPDHMHSIDCNHQWISPTEPCRGCRQIPLKHQVRCPAPCPEPGGMAVVG